MNLKTRNGHFTFCLTVTTAQKKLFLKGCDKNEEKTLYLQKMRTKGIS